MALSLSIWSLTTMYAVWLLQSHWRSEGVELAHFGYIWGALTLLSAVAGRYAASLENRLGTAAMLAFVGIGPVAGYLVMGLAGMVAGVGLSSLFFVCRGFGLVILREALNRRVGSEIRATANSLASFGFRVAFAVTAPLVGGALNLWGLDTTFLLLCGSQCRHPPHPDPAADRRGRPGRRRAARARGGRDFGGSTFRVLKRHLRKGFTLWREGRMPSLQRVPGDSTGSPPGMSAVRSAHCWPRCRRGLVRSEWVAGSPARGQEVLA